MKLIGPFSQIVTLRNLPLKGALQDETLEIIRDGGILIQDGLIKAVGQFNELRNDAVNQIEYIDYDAVALPGLVDSHTHICYHGSRSRDYALRIAGRSYLEIAKAGGGIWDSVQQTRNASKKKLSDGIIDRIQRHQKNGITTCEIKSGYGLNFESELKMLNAIKSANNQVLVDLVSTCLAAHMKPKDFEGDNIAYLDYLLSDLLPIIKDQNLSKRVDIFIEESAFSPSEAKQYLKGAADLGFEITIHGDQFSPGGSQIAVEVGAISVDHLEASTDKEIEMLSKSNVICTALPGASIGLGCRFTPARKLLDNGACLAIASDWNPGSAPMGDLLTQAAILSTFEKLNTAEVFAGITFRAALALGLQDRGILQQNYIADLIAFPTKDYLEILYNQGQMKPEQVWKSGLKMTSND